MKEDILENLNYFHRFNREDVESVSQILEGRHNPSLFGTRRSFVSSSQKAWRLRQMGMTYKEIAKCLHKHPSSIASYIHYQVRVHAS